MNTHRIHRVLSTLCVLSALPAAFAQAVFMGLGDLPGGDFESYAASVSANGRVVVGRSDSTGIGFREEAFRWTRGTGIVGLGLPPVPPSWMLSYALGVSGNGEVAVGGANFQRPRGRVREAFRWTQSEGMVGLGHLPGPQSYSDAFDASDDGSVIVGHSNSTNGEEAFRWTQATGMLGLGDLTGGSFNSAARATTPAGNIVVGHGAASHGLEAFRWTQKKGMVGLGVLQGDSHSDAYAVSADGSVVVGRSGDSAFRWTSETGMVDIGSPGRESRALGITGDGTVIVGHDSRFQVGGRAAIWHPVHGEVSLYDFLTNEHGLDLTGWELSEAVGISKCGTTIVGIGRNPSRDYEAWMVQIIQTGIASPFDIKPGSCPNSFNRASRGNTPAAIAGTNELDVRLIDVECIQLWRADGVGGAVAPLSGPPGPRIRVEDVATPFDGEPCDCHELEGDGVDDLSMKFDTQALVAELELSGLPSGALVELVISGQMLDGTNFSGVDCIRLVPPNGGGLGLASNDGETPHGDTQPKPSFSVGAPKEDAADESPTPAAEPAPIGCGGVMPSFLLAALAGMWLMARRARPI